MRTKIVALCLILVACFCAAACTSAVTPIVPTPTPAPVYRSQTTGKVLPEAAVYKPIGIMIENHRDARPQTGLQAADVVYEAMAEGATRFLAIFNDTLPENVGPVRSARLYYLKFANEWDSIYVHIGGPSSGKASVYTKAASALVKLRVDFIRGTYTKYYWRVKNRHAPHNVYTSLPKLTELIKYEAKGRTFLFDENPSYPGEPVSEVTIPLNDAVTYRYDKDKDVWVRYMGKKPFIDTATNAAIEVKNLIVQYVRYYDGGSKGKWLLDQTGSGKAVFFIGGKMITGTWERESLETHTIYRDDAGNEIVLKPGNTWIAVQSKTKEITVK